MASVNTGAIKAHDVREMLPERRQRREQLLKYFLIGCTASALDVLIFLLLFNGIGTTALLAHSVSVPTAVLFSFFTNARHNFRTRDYVALRLVSFAVVCAIGYATGYAVIMASVASGSDANMGKVFSLPMVFSIQYLLNSRITFRKV